MYKPKVEFYNHYILLLPWPTDLNVCFLLYQSSLKYIQSKMTEKLQNVVFFYFVSLSLWPLTYPPEKVIN